MLTLGKHRGVYVVVSNKDGKRTRRSLGTTDKVKAERLLDQLRAQRPAGLTIAEVFNLYLANREAKNKPTERIKYAVKNLSGAFGSLLPDQITDDRVHAWTAERSLSVKVGTIHVELGYLKAALNWAAGKKLIPEPISIELPQKPRPKTDYLTKPVFLELLNAVQTPHTRLFLVLAIATGARATALLELTWDRIDFDRRLIHLDNPERNRTSKGRATVPMNDTAFKALETAKKGALSNYAIEWGGRPVKSVKTAFRLLSKRAGVKVTPHMLRHSAAVWMAEGGVPMSEISQYLGHSNTTVTERVYARYSPGYLRKAASVLDL